MNIIAGIDSSGEHYLGLIIGDENIITSIHNGIGLNHIHMRKIGDRYTKKTIIQRIILGGNTLAICLKIDRVRIVNRVHHKLTNKSKFKPRKYVHAQFSYILKDFISKYVDSFLSQNKKSLVELKFEADQDMIKTLKTVGLQVGVSSYAHELADAISWANNNQLSIKNLVEHDLENEIESTLTKRLGV